MVVVSGIVKNNRLEYIYIIVTPDGEGHNQNNNTTFTDFQASHNTHIHPQITHTRIHTQTLKQLAEPPHT